jgi:hypothetical protein
MIQFVGMVPLTQHEPITVLTGNGREYDLHNDASFDRLELVASEPRVAIYWRVGARTSRASRGSVALLVLELTKVTACSLKGQLLSRGRGDSSNGLDFIEYADNGNRRASLRFVFDNDAEIEVEAGRCELRTVAAAAASDGISA